MILTNEEWNAVTCAVAVLDGTAGGYTLQEKQQAKAVLERLLYKVAAEHKKARK